MTYGGQMIEFVGYAHLSSPDSLYEFAVTRYHADGSLDTSFGGDGKVTTKVESQNVDAFGYAMALQSDGKVVVGGEQGGNLALARFNSDGTLDSAFDTDGTGTYNVGGVDKIEDVALRQDGRIMVGGSKDNDFVIAESATPTGRSTRPTAPPAATR